MSESSSITSHCQPLLLTTTKHHSATINIMVNNHCQALIPPTFCQRGSSSPLTFAIIHPTGLWRFKLGNFPGRLLKQIGIQFRRSLHKQVRWFIIMAIVTIITISWTWIISVIPNFVCCEFLGNRNQPHRFRHYQHFTNMMNCDDRDIMLQTTSLDLLILLTLCGVALSAAWLICPTNCNNNRCNLNHQRRQRQPRRPPWPA